MIATVDIDNRSKSTQCPDQKTCLQWFQQTLAVAGRETSANLSLCFVEPDESARLNQQYRDKPSATNVLSFPSEVSAEMIEQLGFNPLGDLVVCPSVIEEEAQAQGKAPQDHWAHIVIHGVLHLCGFDHQDESGTETMENLEIEILKTLGISNPYLIG